MLQLRRNPLTPALAVGAALGALVTLPAQRADACGCFAPPDPSVPIVQAGEQIVFSHEDGTVTAHIQIQYEGTAEEFGWILPLPAVPDMKLGTEELFAQVIATTQPRYRLNRDFEDSCGIANFGGVPTADSGARGNNEAEEPGVVVKQDSIGPFDFAVLRGDDKEEMFTWLRDNRYFIPVGTDEAVDQYVHDGAYFLALKLRKGNDVGDIQPVVVEYASDLPMIPIVLTQVAANPDMGIRVWVLGEDRAIPRNYRHTILNEEYIDWFDAGRNYNEVIIAATNEAPDGQSFVTEYAGSTERMVGLLDRPGRFGNRADYAQLADIGLYVEQLRFDGFPWSSGLLSALRRHVPYPEGLAQAGVDEEEFYLNADYYLNRYREDHPELFEGYEPDFDPEALTAQLWERIVTPTLEAGRLFRDNPKMTRMYTTLSPEEMTVDPVFSFNPSLPDVSNEHVANFTQFCDGSGNPQGAGILELPDGRKFYIADPSDWSARNPAGVPYSRRIELLREEGAPVVEVDNTARISESTAGDSGCTCAAPTERSGAGALFALALAGGLVFLRRRR